MLVNKKRTNVKQEADITKKSLNINLMRTTYLLVEMDVITFLEPIRYMVRMMVSSGKEEIIFYFSTVT